MLQLEDSSRRSEQANLQSIESSSLDAHSARQASLSNVRDNVHFMSMPASQLEKGGYSTLRSPERTFRFRPMSWTFLTAGANDRLGEGT